MALFPCDATSHRYPGAQQTIYPAIVNQSDTWRRKLRLCPQHFRGFLDQLEAHAQNAQLSFEDALSVRCVSCSNPVTDSPFQFFATVYATKADRADWWGPVHEGCAASLADDWLLDATIDS